MTSRPDEAFARALAAIAPLDRAAVAEAGAHQARLTKPRGALGRLEDLGAQLAGIAAEAPPPVPDPATVVVFAGDHGVWAERVTPWPQEVTAQMVSTFCAGGAAINVLARHVGAGVLVVDVGVKAPLDPSPALVDRKVRPGTANITTEPAMTVDEARLALDVGAQVAADTVAAGARCLVTGDMGIANTTASAALIAAFTGRVAADVTGRGTGIDDLTWARKVRVVERALARARSDGTLTARPDPLAVLASLGGLEMAALAGFAIGGAAARVPVVVDGVVALAGALAGAALAPLATGCWVAGHRSVEPGASAALDHLGLEPVLDLGMRLGEGSGACLALPVLQAAAKVLREMATFDTAGVTEKT
jgi:nicotinate-nucleotide--dimethylbenzimidazole phosphoribosyltransferase